MNLMKYLMGQMLLMDQAGDPPAGGGGNNPPSDPPQDPPKDDPNQTLQAKLMARIDALEAQLKSKNNPPSDPPSDPSLADKAKLEREKAEADKAKTGKLEKALTFNLSSKDWFKTNESLLPPSIEGILAEAEKENYDSAVDKADAIKVGIVSEFFAQQANLDLLTPSQKNQLADFNSLTKNVKQERVSSIYDSIFEPTFEMMKRVKKAERVSKGLGDPSNKDEAYTKKMIEISSKKYNRGGN